MSGAVNGEQFVDFREGGAALAEWVGSVNGVVNFLFPHQKGGLNHAPSTDRTINAARSQKMVPQRKLSAKRGR